MGNGSNGFAIFGKISFGLLILAGVWFGGNWGYNAIADIGVRECTRAKEKEIAGLKTQITKLTTDLGAEQKLVTENAKAVADAKGIVADHQAFVYVVNQVCDNGTKVHNLNDSYERNGTIGVVCYKSGATVNSVAFVYVRAADNSVSDIKLSMVDGKPGIVEAVQANTPQATNR